MNYFTTDLFVRLQNLQDRTANEDWEQAVGKYDAHLRRIRSQLPRSLRRIVEEFSLHDAEVLCMSRRRDTLSISLQLDPPTEFLLVLEYVLVAEPEINPSALAVDYCSDWAGWLYDEVEVERPRSGTRAAPKNGRAAAGASGAVYVHRILLGNGWEVALRFRHVRLSRPQALIPGPLSEPMTRQSSGSGLRIL